MRDASGQMSGRGAGIPLGQEANQVSISPRSKRTNRWRRLQGIFPCFAQA
jgi:hypothetical protein